MSKSREYLEVAKDKGYYVDDEGAVWFRGKARKLDIDAWGRPKFSIKVGKSTKSILVHRLAGYQKWGEEMFDHEVIRHLDGNAKNNKQSNLALGTQQQNMMDRTPEDLLSHARVAAKHQRKISDEQLSSFWKDRNNGFSLKDLSKKYGISKSTASYIVNGKTYKK